MESTQISEMVTANTEVIEDGGYIPSAPNSDECMEVSIESNITIELHEESTITTQQQIIPVNLGYGYGFGGYMVTPSAAAGQQFYTGPMVIPGSPSFMPGSPTFMPGSPTFMPGSPTFMPGSPTFMPGSPTFIPGSPTFIPGSPTFMPGTPTFMPDGPPFTPCGPQLMPETQSFGPITHSPPNSYVQLAHGPAGFGLAQQSPDGFGLAQQSPVGFGLTQQCQDGFGLAHQNPAPISAYWFRSGPFNFTPFLYPPPGILPLATSPILSPLGSPTTLCSCSSCVAMPAVLQYYIPEDIPADQGIAVSKVGYDDYAEEENYVPQQEQPEMFEEDKVVVNNVKKNRARKRICTFCRSNNESIGIWASHVTQKGGKTICPILRKYICPVCQATGNQAHTLKYCPLNKTPPQHVHVRTGRSAAGMNMKIFYQQQNINRRK